MKAGRKLIFLYVSAFVLFTTGLVSTVVTVKRMPLHARRLDRAIKTFMALRDLEQVKARRDSAVRAFELLESGAPESLSALATAHFSGVTPEIREREPIDLSNGWSLRRMEITCGDLNLERIPAFIKAAEAGRPPWILAECNITAFRQDGGYGRVTLIMEALSRND